MKKTYKLLPILGLILFLSSCSNGEYKYQKSVDDTFEVGKNISVISVDKLAEIIYGEDTVNFQFIDIRTPHDFNISHVTKAINIPISVLQGDNCETFCDNDKTFLIYGYEATDARLATSYLNQMGINNVLAVGGGYDFIENNILNQFGIYSNSYDDEIALYDYKTVIAETPKGNASTSNAGPVSFVPVARKTEGATGGCE